MRAFRFGNRMKQIAMDRRKILLGGGFVAALGAGAVYVGGKQMGCWTNYNDAVQAMRSPLPLGADVHDLIRYATLAPNSHNTQAWRFARAPRQIVIQPDFSRRTPVVDPDDHHLFVSLGCAAENLQLAAAARGQPGELRFDNANDGSISFDYQDGAPSESALFGAIAQRQSTRAEYEARAVSPTDLKTLALAAATPGVDTILITDRVVMDRVRDLIIAGNSAQMGDRAFMRELKSWLRFNPQQALKSGDGLYSVASGNPALPKWLGSRAFDMLATAKSENEKYARQLRFSAGVAVFVGAQNNREHWVLAGRACQRFALQATALGLKHAFINQPLEVARLRPDLAALIGQPARRPDILMRFGYGPTMPFSARRPVAAVLS